MPQFWYFGLPLCSCMRFECSFRALRKFLGVATLICPQRFFSPTKFSNKERFTCVPTSTSINGVLQICPKAKYPLQICRQVKFLGRVRHPHVPYGLAPAQVKEYCQFLEKETESRKISAHILQLRKTLNVLAAKKKNRIMPPSLPTMFKIRCTIGNDML